MNIEKFKQQLQEAATWLEFITSTNGSKIFRSSEIQPENLIQEIGYPSFDLKEKDIQLYEKQLGNYYATQKRIINNVFEIRSSILKEKNIPLLEINEVLKRGILLYAYVNQTVTDGASEAESNCLFDVYDTPAWDTWVWLHNSGNDAILVAWIPTSQVQYAEGAIAVNCVDCIQWAANSSNDLSNLLNKHGLIKPPKLDPSFEPDLKEFHINVKLLEEMYQKMKQRGK